MDHPFNKNIEVPEDVFRKMIQDELSKSDYSPIHFEGDLSALGRLLNPLISPKREKEIVETKILYLNKEDAQCQATNRP